MSGRDTTGPVAGVLALSVLTVAESIGISDPSCALRYAQTLSFAVVPVLVFAMLTRSESEHFLRIVLVFLAVLAGAGQFVLIAAHLKGTTGAIVAGVATLISVAAWVVVTSTSHVD